MADKNKKKLDFASLYPTPKTVDEIYSENEARQKRIIARQPKYITIRTALELTGLFVLFVATAAVAPAVILWNVMAGVPAGFMLVLIVAGLEYWEAHRVTNFFSYKDSGVQLFYLAYWTCALALLYMWFAHQSSNFLASALTVAIVAGAHFMVTWLIAEIITNRRLSEPRKLATMIAIILVLFAVILEV
jgi:hypothetical protein